MRLLKLSRITSVKVYIIYYPKLPLRIFLQQQNVAFSIRTLQRIIHSPQVAPQNVSERPPSLQLSQI